MEQGYPPAQYPGQMAYTDQGGYTMQQNPSMMGYPPGLPQQQAYPPPPMMQAPEPYPPSAGSEDPYAHAQQYGLTREETEGALEAYKEMNDTDRGLMSSFGMGSAQGLLSKVFGSSGNEQMISSLVSVLGSALASGKMPSLTQFISLMGQYKMNTLGQSTTGHPMGTGGGHGGQGGQHYAGLGPMGTGYGQVPPGGQYGQTPPGGQYGQVPQGGPYGQAAPGGYGQYGQAYGGGQPYGQYGQLPQAGQYGMNPTGMGGYGGTMGGYPGYQESEHDKHKHKEKGKKKKK